MNEIASKEHRNWNADRGKFSNERVTSAPQPLSLANKRET